MQFEEVYNTYYNRVLRYFISHTDSVQDAEDLATNVFIKCYKSFDSYDSSKAGVVTWLYSIASNSLKNYYRDKKNNVSLDDPDNELHIADKTDLSKAVELSEMRKLLADALCVLDEDKRRIVVLRYFGDKSTKEIAQLTGLSDTNVRVTLNRSLTKMREYLKKSNIRWEF